MRQENIEVTAMVSIKDVVDALDTASDDLSSYVNRATGEVVTVSHEDLRDAEEGLGADAPTWRQEVVAETKRILESDDWLELPSKFEVNEWQIMASFGASLAAESDRTAVADAIHGKGAFRSFKATIGRLGIERAWFSYKTAALEAIAREWLGRNGLHPSPAA